VFWDLNRSNTSNPNDKQCQARTFLDLLSFVPGLYSFTVEAKLYSASDSEDDRKYHTLTETTTLKVSIPQLYAMWAAGIGALIAYAVMALRAGGDVARVTRAESRREILTSVLIVARNLFSAALLGASITIIASRLADTAFPIKVSVDDIWGALTIGFVSYFVGYKIIDKLAKA
jgi:hypothetical protein